MAGTSFLVLPFHPMWLRARVPGHVRAFCTDYDNLAMLQRAFESHDPFAINVSWELVTAPLGNSLVE